jgi:RNA polymerase sigma-70 factor (ECF subfamily)
MTPLREPPQSASQDESDSFDRTADLELVRRIQAGDRQAFDDFVNRLLPMLHRYAARRVHEPDLVHDIVQSSVCKAIESLGNYRGDGPLMGWACGICRFEVMAVYRRDRRWRYEALEETGEVHHALAILQGADDPEQDVQRNEAKARVHLTLDQLPEHYARALEWKYVEGLAVDEIARRQGTTAKAIESTLSRARAAFRKLFPGHT